MRAFASRLIDARNTVEGRILSVLLSVLLAASLFNVGIFTAKAAADEDASATVAAEEILSTDLALDTSTVDLTDEAETVQADAEANAPQDAVINDAAIEVSDAEALSADEAPQAFNGYAVVDGVVVRVTAAAGIVPEGATVAAKRVDEAAIEEAIEQTVAEEGKTVEGYQAIDVTLINEGVEIQPNGIVNVTFENTRIEGAEGNELAVFHITDDAQEVASVNAIKADANTQSFDVSHFSIYAVAALGSVDTVKVAVYATDGTKEGENLQAFKELLNLPYAQTEDGYYPLGVIELPRSVFNGKQSPYIKDNSDFKKVIKAIGGIDVSYLQNEGEKNAGHTVAQNLDVIQEDHKAKAGEYQTALFDWNIAEVTSDGGTNIALVDGGYYEYHLDLRFQTIKVTYKFVDEKGDSIKGAPTITANYLKDIAITEPEASQVVSLKVPSGYSVARYEGYKFGEPASSDTTIRVVCKHEPVQITFDPNGGELSYKGSVQTEPLMFDKYEFGAYQPNVSDPTRDGYTFEGWEENGVVYTGAAIAALKAYSPHTYTAKWKEADKSYEVVKTHTISKAAGNINADKAEVGDIVIYTVTVTSTGNTKTDKITLTDKLTGGDATKVVRVSADISKAEDGTLTMEVGQLNPKASKSFIYTYTIQETDKELTNAVYVNNEEDPKVEDKVTVEENKAYTVEKTAVVLRDGNEVTDANADGNIIAKTSDTIQYTVTVTNTGNVKTDAMHLEDVFSGIKDALEWEGTELLKKDGKLYVNVPAIDVNDNFSATYAYEVKTTDTTLTNQIISEKGDDKVVVVVEGNMTYEKSKTVKVLRNGVEVTETTEEGIPQARVGDVLEYTVTVNNTGNVPTDVLRIKDTFNGVGKLEAEHADLLVNGDGKNYEVIVSSAEVGQTASTTYTYVVQPTDYYLNNVITDEDGKGIEVPVNVEENKAYTIEKTATVDGKEIQAEDKVKVGDTITYTLSATNTGNAAVGNVQLVDEMRINSEPVALPESIDGLNDNVLRSGNNITINQLAKGETIKISYDYTVKATDATIANVLKSDEAENGNVEVVVPVEENPGLKIFKTSQIFNKNGNYGSEENPAKPGDVIEYTIGVANTGNTTIESVVIDDVMTNASGDIKIVGKSGDSSVTWNAETKQFIFTTTILPNNSATFLYTYTIQTNDAGKAITNVATVEGSIPNTEAPSNPDPVYVKAFSLTGTIDNEGTIENNDQSVKGGEMSEPMMFKAAKGYRIDQIKMNGTTLQGVVTEGMEEYTFESMKMTEDVKVEVNTVPLDAVSFVVPSITRSYNGQEASVSFEDVQIMGLPLGYYVKALVTGARTDFGTTPATISFIQIFDANGAEMTSRFEDKMSVTNGTINITRAQVYIVVDDSTKVAGQADPTFTGRVARGTVFNNDLGRIIYVRTSGGEAAGVYQNVLWASYTANNNYDVFVTPGTFTITAAPVVPAAIVPGAPAPVPGVAAPAPAPAEDITDDATPMAQNPEGEEEEIVDDENPLGAFDVKHCWTHWLMLLGMLCTAAYGIAVARRRSSFTKDLDDFEKSFTGETAKKRETVSASNASHQAI